MTYGALFVPKAGIEPALCCQNWILNPARLPIPPLRLLLESAKIQKLIEPIQIVLVFLRQEENCVGSFLTEDYLRFVRKAAQEFTIFPLPKIVFNDFFQTIISHLVIVPNRLELRPNAYQRHHQSLCGCGGARCLPCQSHR